MKLFRDGLTIACVDGLTQYSGPSEGSVNVPITIDCSSDDEYADYTQEVHVRYLLDNQSIEAILPFANSQYTLTSPIFEEDGPLQIAVHLTKGEVRYVTNELHFVKNKAPNGATEVDPSQYDWQQLVDMYCDEKFETKAKEIESVVTTAKAEVDAEIATTNTNVTNLTTRVSTAENTINTINTDLTDAITRILALETWKSQVLAGATTVLVETEATSTTSDDDEAVSDTAINTEGLSEPTLGDVEVEETTEEAEVESSESLSTSESQSESSSESLSESLSESESTSTSESSSESESESMSESLSDSDSTSESQSESNTESEVTSESIQIEPQTKEELS